jgi:hypothetical protein
MFPACKVTEQLLSTRHMCSLGRYFKQQLQNYRVMQAQLVNTSRDLPGAGLHCDHCMLRSVETGGQSRVLTLLCVTRTKQAKTALLQHNHHLKRS